MSKSSFIAVFFVALFIGAGCTYYFVNQQTNARLSDKSFLEKQIQRLESTGASSSSSQIRKPLVRIKTAELQAIANERQFDGRLVEINRVIVASEVSGLIRRMPVEVGTQVVKGQTLLVDVDTTWLDIALIQAQRQIECDRVDMELQKAELNRLEQIKEKQADFITQSELEKQQALAEEAVARHKLSEAAASEIREKLARTKIYAPFSGSIVRKMAELGGYVSPGSPLVEIVSSGQVDAMFNIGEDIISRIKIGDPLDVYICPLSKTVTGKIESIVPLGATAARTFPVRVRLSDEEGLLKVGMSVCCTLATTDRREQLVVNRDAVLEKPDDCTVWVVSPDATGDYKAAVVPVYIQAKAGNWVAVTTARKEDEKLLTPGVQTVVEGAERLMPDQTVQISELDARFLKDLPTASGMQSFKHRKQ